MNILYTGNVLISPVVATTYGFSNSDGTSQTITVSKDGSVATTLINNHQLVATCSIISLCLMVTACAWMFFRYKKQRIAINEVAINKIIDERFKKVDERLANLETIALDREKERKFDSL